MESVIATPPSPPLSGHPRLPLPPPTAKMAPGSAAAASSKDGACAHAREGAGPVRILAGSGSARGGERGA